MISNSEYWRKRYEELRSLTDGHEDEFIRNLKKQFSIANKNIERKIERFYMQFADEEGISILEARKLLNDNQLEAFHMDVKEYIKLLEEYDDTRSEKLKKELQRASIKYRVTRLEAIQLQLTGEAIRAYTGIDSKLVSLLMADYLEQYNHTAFILFKGFGIGTTLNKINKEELNTLLHKPWLADGKNFSERVWSNREKLVENLSTTLTQGLIAGSSYTEMIEDLAKRMNASLNNCARVVVTESTYFSSLSQEQCWNDLGVEQYEIVVVLDDSTCKICGAQDGVVYDMKDFKAGQTAPPFHVNCRCTTAPYFDDRDVPGYVVGTRAARDKEGRTYQVPADMTYQEWIEVYGV